MSGKENIGDESDSGLTKFLGSITKGILDLTTEEIKEPGASTTSQQQPEKINPSSGKLPTDTEVMNELGADDKTYNTIINAIRKPDGIYGEFFDMVQSLLEDIKEESVAYRAAAKALLKQGYSYDVLIREIQTLINALPEQQKIFESAGAKKLSEIGIRENEITNITQQIENLRQKISNLEAEQAIKQTGIIADRKKIEDAKLIFDATLAKVKSDLSAKLENAKKFLNGGK